MKIAGRFPSKPSPPKRSTPCAQEANSPAPTDLKDAFASSERQELSLGLMVFAGISLLGAACTSQPGQAAAASEVWVESPPSEDVCLRAELPQARVIVVDDFSTADTGTTHGEIVEAELQRNHQIGGDDADIVVERQQVGLYDGDHGLQEGRPGALEDVLRAHFAGRMTRDADALERILEGGGPRGVIHQSQGASQSRAVDALYYRSLRDDQFGMRVQEQLGLPQSNIDSQRDKKELMQRLVSLADRIQNQDESVIAARHRLRDIQESLHERGFIHVISAGNQGYLSRDMQSLGVAPPETFFTNDFADEHSIIVGAADNDSKEVDGARLGVAALASPSAGAHLAADGVDRPLFVDGHHGHHSGSSYAAPQVSSVIANMLRAEPGITRDEALLDLQQVATPVPGQESFLGAGVLRQPGSLLCSQ